MNTPEKAYKEMITEAQTRGDFLSMKNSDIKDPKDRAIQKKMLDIEKKREPLLVQYKKINNELSKLMSQMEDLWGELG